MPFFVNEEAGDASRARVDIFVGTKYSKINTPVVQREGHVSHSVRKIPSTDTTLKSKIVSTRSKNKKNRRGVDGRNQRKPNYISHVWRNKKITLSWAFFVTAGMGNHCPV